MSAQPAADILIPKLRTSERVDLYLDYDGTLAPFAPTPDDVLPDANVIGLAMRLVRSPQLHVALLSGRRLAHIRKLLPVPGLLLAGTYGVEMLLPDGRESNRLPYDSIRPTLEDLKPLWQALIEGKQGFFLEDKGWALAIHARKAEAQEGDDVLQKARALLTPQVLGPYLQIIPGYRFLEIGPRLADKGQALDYLFKLRPWPNAIPIYIGDDDKDEEAFRVINAHKGLAIRVGPHEVETQAGYRLDSPAAVHAWLREAFLSDESK